MLIVLLRKVQKHLSFGPEAWVPVPRNCTFIIKQWVQNKAAVFWMSLNTCRQTKDNFPVPIKQIGAKALLRLDRLGLRHVIQVLTGHCNLAKHRHITGHVVSPDCPMCGLGVETPQHLVESCPIYYRLRDKHLKGTLTELKEIASDYKWINLSKFLRATSRLENFDQENTDT